MGSRYQRHLSLPDFTRLHQERLRAAHVLVVGAGGLAAPVLTYLAGSGVGDVTVMDDDQIDETNLQRQVLFTVADIGRSKAVVAAERVRALNPDVRVHPSATRFSTTTPPQIRGDLNLVVDCSDNLPTRYLLESWALSAGATYVWAAIGQYAGRCSVVSPQVGACFECVYGPADKVAEWPSGVQSGVFGPVCGMVGALAAAEAIKVLTGLGEPLVGRMAMVDAWSGDLTQIAIHPDPHCRTCAHRSMAT
ncbi:MAG: HesA/MoeB/ThiF family protein [Propionibacteriaceae bacterium]|jgi:adenylyltransferase/sulfurtransferase|nr:HesA/MoeB/ThiF family protein [Propionibacteriaceae bacterium]